MDSSGSHAPGSPGCGPGRLLVVLREMFDAFDAFDVLDVLEAKGRRDLSSSFLRGLGLAMQAHAFAANDWGEFLKPMREADPALASGGSTAASLKILLRIVNVSTPPGLSVLAGSALEAGKYSTIPSGKRRREHARATGEP